MDKISLYVLDTRKYSFGELLALTKLDESEISFLERYHVLDVKKEKLVSYYFKKKYVGDYSLSESGKPISNNVFFNISDSKGMVVLAISKNREVGVDVEILMPKDQDLVKYVCSEEEYQFVKNEIDFVSVWTSKESIVKCLGTGIKSNIKGIPALPLNGKKIYEGQAFYSMSFRYGDSIISLTLKGEEEFDYTLISEDTKHEQESRT